MSIKIKLTPLARKEKVQELKMFHLETFKELNISESIYIPKMAHFVTGLQGLHMGFFESEINHGQDVYTEKVSKVMESEDPQRVLYKYKYNPHFQEEYSTSAPVSTGNVRYLVPVEELEIVDSSKLGDEEFNLMNPDEDLPLDQLTIRDLAALLLKKPVSKKVWLNQIINKK